MNPYPGLRPFQFEEAALFFGREIAVDLFATQIQISPLMVMFARSGVGKSSFLACRLIPELRASTQVAYLNEWGGGSSAEELIDQCIRSVSVGNGFTGIPVLVLDQFEDVFKVSSKRKRERLWNRLAELVNVQEPEVHVLICMREEWLGAWGEAAEYLPDALRSMMRLSPLTRKELTRAIEGPAEHEGSVRVDPELAEELLSDLKRPDAYGLGDEYVEAGLVQLVCRRLWEEATEGKGKVMSIDLYNDLGRASNIVREFVWSRMGQAGMKGCPLSATDRVLWVGISRHLMFAPGAKAIVTSKMVARNLRFEDMGVAGPAVIDRSSRKYLRVIPQRRSEPPASLTASVTEALDRGVDAGFLKRYASTGSDGFVYELWHDSLGDILQQFSLECDRWIGGRFKRLQLASGALLLGLPLIACIIHVVGGNGDLSSNPVDGVLLWPIFAAIYIVLLWLFAKPWISLYHMVAFAAMRRIIKGKVLLRAADKRGHQD